MWLVTWGTTAKATTAARPVAPRSTAQVARRGGQRRARSQPAAGARTDASSRAQPVGHEARQPHGSDHDEEAPAELGGVLEPMGDLLGRSSRLTRRQGERRLEAGAGAGVGTPGTKHVDFMEALAGAW